MSDATKPALVVFDMAGTTVSDTGNAVGECLRAALSAAGVAVTVEQINPVMGYPKPEAIRRLIALMDGGDASDGALAPSQVDRIHDDFVARMIAYYRTDPRVAPIPGAEATFRRLRGAGVYVTLDTGFSRPIADVILDRLGWQGGEVIDGSVTSDEVARGRPFPDMVHRLMERFGVADPERVAKVGDTPSDLEEGTAAGCGWVIGVAESGSHDAPQLAAWPHTHLVGSVADLPGLFDL